MKKKSLLSTFMRHVAKFIETRKQNGGCQDGSRRKWELFQGYSLDFARLKSSGNWLHNSVNIFNIFVFEFERKILSAFSLIILCFFGHSRKFIKWDIGNTLDSYIRFLI